MSDAERDLSNRQEQGNAVINLANYGYGPGEQELTDRLTPILESGSVKIVTEAVNIFGIPLTTYASALPLEDFPRLDEWMQGVASPNQDSLVRLGISIDYARKMRELGENETIITSLFAGMKAQFNDQSMITAVRRFEPQDLAAVHRIYMDIVYAQSASLPYSAQGPEEIAIKYFPEPMDLGI